MATKNLIVGLSIFVLLVLVIIFGVRSSTNAAKAQEALQMGEVLLELLRVEGYTTTFDDCRGLGASDFTKLQACLAEIKSPHDLSELFREDQFQDADLLRNETGYLIILNSKGEKTFASTNFTLFVNNVEKRVGCTTPGVIAPGYTCKFLLDTPCAPGDNLEVKYNTKRVFLKTC